MKKCKKKGKKNNVNILLRPDCGQVLLKSRKLKNRKIKIKLA